MSPMKGHNMDDLVTMSNREISRLEVMQRLRDKCLKQSEAARMLGISERQVKRLFRAYKALGAGGLVSRRRGRPRHQPRERRAGCGELVQIDGSDHDWFEGRAPRCTLLVYIHDATGQLGELWFVAGETTFADSAPS